MTPTEHLVTKALRDEGYPYWFPYMRHVERDRRAEEVYEAVKRRTGVSDETYDRCCDILDEADDRRPGLGLGL
jgi:hypothetical protein